MSPIDYSSEDGGSDYEYCPAEDLIYETSSITSDGGPEDEDAIEDSEEEEASRTSKLPRRSPSVSHGSDEGQHNNPDTEGLIKTTIYLDVLKSESKALHVIRQSDFVYPTSQYDGFVPPLRLSSEKSVVDDFMRDFSQGNSRTNSRCESEEFVEFSLTNFSIYNPSSAKKYSGTMTGLQNLCTKNANTSYCFNGVLRHGNQQHYVQDVSFKICSIGNYGHEKHTVDNHIWIKSEFNNGSDIFYRLRTPSKEYDRYHEGFLWLANLSKHFVDYLVCASEKRSNVSIHNFRSDFASWMDEMHSDSPAYQEWYGKFGSPNFQGHIAANIEFLWKEAYGIGHEKLSAHKIWKETRTKDFIAKQDLQNTKTIVTPYVNSCFRHLGFGDFLESVAPSRGLEARLKALGFSPQPLASSAIASEILPREAKASEKRLINIGDVLGVSMDDKRASLWKDEGSKWKAADECWYLLVQGIHVDDKGFRYFDGIWLYRPSDTACAKMKYPYPDELFLSDNCNCDSRRKVFEDEILCQVSVRWNGLPGNSDSTFFVRQTWLKSLDFITFKESHKRCIHFLDASKTPLETLVDMYSVGDTVLYVPLPGQTKKRGPERKPGLEPGEIVEFLPKGQKDLVKIRRLIRRRAYDSTKVAAANELVYSEEIIEILADKVEGKCFVRLFDRLAVEEKRIPVPYNRNGTGNAFYIITRVGKDGLQPIHQNLPQTLRQGPDFKSLPSQQRLRGLDLFCGGGNFGRGLEEGGAIKNTHAVDNDENAIHTYYANLEHPKSTKMFLGSVDDMLAQALKNNPSKCDLIPTPGVIDFISAGSPCPGYSMLNSRRNEDRGRKLQSLVASVAAYIDVYRPSYALLENVIAMAQKNKGRDEDVLSQLVCCLVGMGYQIKIFNLDAWSFGSPQSRGRLFVAAAAAGLEPLEYPYRSHSHPVDTKERGLGLLANGHSFGNRAFGPTPFGLVTAAEATIDLPGIGDGRTYHCTKHPDHRMSITVTDVMKRQIESIPLTPHGMNFVKTWNSRKMNEADRQLFPLLSKDGKLRECAKSNSKAWGRVNPQSLFPTITTVNSVTCARSGVAIHWDQQRLLTILEARRAQSFPDDEVLIGIPTAQRKIIGNSVARTVALAFGISVEQARIKNSERKENVSHIKNDVQEKVLNRNFAMQGAKAAGYITTQGLDKGINTSASATDRESPAKNRNTDTPSTSVNVVVEIDANVAKRRYSSILKSGSQPAKRVKRSGPISGERSPEFSISRAMASDLSASGSPGYRTSLSNGFTSVHELPSSSNIVIKEKPKNGFHSEDISVPLPMRPKSQAPSSFPPVVLLEDSDDDVVFVSANKKRPIKYVPVDNSFMNPYAETNAMIRPGKKRKSRS